MAKAFGARLPKCSTASFAKRCRTALPEELATAVTSVLHVLEVLNSAIRDLDIHVERLASEVYPETQRLTQVPGVGSLTALTYRLTIDDPGSTPRLRREALLIKCPSPTRQRSPS